jgi:hypothetical protein
MTSTYRDHDLLTVAAIACTAFLVADLSHELLGHGVVAHFSGAKQIVLSYTYLSSDIQSRWISIAGPVVNVVEGLVALVLLRALRLRAAAALFLFLLMSFNLLDAAAYPIYSGVLGSGDLAVVIAGLPHLGALRVALDVGGLLLYVVFTFVGGRALGRFIETRERLTTTAYIAAIALNCCAGLMNPLGLKYFLLSALPATAGANAGMFVMPAIARRSAGEGAVLGVQRSLGWVIAGAALAAFFIFFVGRGIALAG